MLGAIFAHIFRKFVKVFRDFAQISTDFARIFTKSKILTVCFHPHHLHQCFTDPPGGGGFCIRSSRPTLSPASFMKQLIYLGG